jgi:flagellin-like hook-associated protein FlgL
MVMINQNLYLQAQHNLVEAQNSLTTAVNALTTGKRVNAAQDDAASLAISQNLVSQIKTINQSINNLNNVTNVLQVTDSAINSIQNIVLRIKELSAFGINDSLSDSQRVAIVNELDQLNTEIDHVIDRTTFNGNGLLTNYGELDTRKSSLKLNQTSVGVLDTTVASVINVSEARPGIYKFSSSGDELTLTKTDFNDNVFGSQSLTVLTPSGSSFNQTLNFNAHGISIRLSSSTIGINGLTDDAEEIARNLSNLFQPIVVNEAINLRFGSDSGSSSLINFRPINLSTTAFPDAEWDYLPNQNGVANTNPAAIQALPSPTTAKGAYAITINQSAATTQFEYVGFSGTTDTVGINNDFTFTVGDRVYYANGNKVQNGVTTNSAVPTLSGSTVSITSLTNWINGLNDSNVSARLYQRSTGDYSVKVDGGLSGASNAISFTGMNLAVAKNFYTGARIYGSTSLAADGKITTSFSGYIVDDPYSATNISVSGGLSAYEGNGNQFLDFGIGDKWLYTNYTNKSDGVASMTSDGLLIGSELNPNPTYVSYYPYPYAYNYRYDIANANLSDYLGNTDTYRRDNQAPYNYAYNSNSWNTNFTSNLKLLTSVVNIDPARDANLTITNSGSTRRITNSSNVFTDSTSGLALNITSNTQPWDTPANASITIGDANPPLPPNNSNLVAIDHAITTLKGYSSAETNDAWRLMFAKLQNQSEKAFSYLSYERGILGAQMNRVGFIATNLSSQSLNLEKSKSDLIDADVGEVTAQFMKEKVHLEAASHMVKEASNLASPIKTLMKLWDDIKSK